jgi:hypothetical protein
MHAYEMSMKGIPVACTLVRYTLTRHTPEIYAREMHAAVGALGGTRLGDVRL